MTASSFRSTVEAFARNEWNTVLRPTFSPDFSLLNWRLNSVPSFPPRPVCLVPGMTRALPARLSTHSTKPSSASIGWTGTARSPASDFGDHGGHSCSWTSIVRVPTPDKTIVSRRGDLWTLGAHRLLCGDARSLTDVDRLMAGRLARMTFADPPYNVPIVGHVQGRGRLKHAEFAFGSGEMTADEFTDFLRTTLGHVARVSAAGAIAFVCMDWRHMTELNAAGRDVFSRLMNLVIWNKTSPGQGSFYRSQHELIFVFKVGEGEHTNTFGLGRNGRMRSNVWTYPGANSFHADRKAELAMHPTVKPVALVADALRDCSLKGDMVLDLFGGSGTTLLAAEKLGRKACLLEYEPKYVDVTIRRWQAYTKLEAVLAYTGKTWAEVREERAAAADRSPSAPTVTHPTPGQPADPDEGAGAAWVLLCGGQS